jgi:glycosyltransferase involved in cell wall biosynthesis
MRIAFYSPIAKPNEQTPSGVSRVGALIVQALQAAGHRVDVPPLPRSYEGKGDAKRQAHIFSECENATTNYLEAIALGKEPRPDLWFSYHVYYKSPDWIGPHVAKSLGIPYLIAEGSHAPKRAKGPWALGHAATTKALQSADRLLAMTSFDRVCLEWINETRVRDLKPFIDPTPFAHGTPGATRSNHVIAVGMMRNDRKLASYRLLSEALRELADEELILEIVGDGPHRDEIERSFIPRSKKHLVTFSGSVIPHYMPLHVGSCAIFAWPGVGEAYGLAYLEAQAAGLAVVACRDRGVPDVVKDGETALLSEPGDTKAYASNLRRALTDEALRERLGRAARTFVTSERSIAAAARTLNGIMNELQAA